MKNKLDLNQPFVDFLTKTLESSRANKTRTLTRVCNALLATSSHFKEKTVKDILETDFKDLMIYRGFGPSSKKGYFALQKALFDAGVEGEWPFLNVLEMEESSEKTAIKGISGLRVTVKPVRIHKTDPETTVYQIIVNFGKGLGIWKETANSPRGVFFFFQGLQAMACFAGFPLLPLPEIPKANQ